LTSEIDYSSIEFYIDLDEIGADIG